MVDHIPSISLYLTIHILARDSLHARSFLALVLFVKIVEMFLVCNLVDPHASSLRIQRTLVVGLAEKRLDGEEDGPDVVQCTPLFLEDV